MLVFSVFSGMWHTAKPVIYMVDTSILLTAKSGEELQIKIPSTLDYMLDWFSVNGLVLNKEKTNTAKFTWSYQHNEPFQIAYHNKKNYWG